MKIANLLSLFCLLLLITASGCAMCANPFDECYCAFGGSRPRADMLAGRVGSAFVEAGQWAEADEVVAPVVNGDTNSYESHDLNLSTEVQDGVYYEEGIEAPEEGI